MAAGEKRTLLFLGVAVCVLLAGVAVFVWRGLAARDIIDAYLPAPPNTDLVSEILTERVAQADRKASGFLFPLAGLIELSRLYHANGYYEEAIACYEGLQQAKPAEAKWVHLHASIFSEFGRLDEALPLRERAVELAPEYLPAYLRRADTLLKLNRVSEASAAYDKALRLVPEDGYALLGLARCAIAEDDWGKARGLLDRALESHPDFFGALSLAATVAEHLGEDARARKLRTAIASREFSDVPDPWMDALIDDCYDAYRLSVVAAVAKSAGKLDVARKHLGRSVDLEPERGTYRRQLAGVLSELGELEAAGEELERAVALTPHDSDSWFQLVQNRIGLGDQNAAARVLKRGLKACPESPSLHLENGRYLNAIGRTEDAIAAYRESYRLRPSEASPLVELATIYYTAGRADEAVATLHEALRKLPEHPIAMTTLALIAIEKGNDEEARSWWLRVKAQPGAPPEAAATIRKAFETRFFRRLE